MKRFFAPVFVPILITIIFFCGYASQVNAASVWTEETASGYRQWMAIASSADGTKLVAGAQSDYIYTSSDGGITWIAQTSSGQRNWNGIASSADGTKLAATHGATGATYTSIDGGATWIARSMPGSNMWVAITSSADGLKLAAASNSGYIATSVDGGVTWIEQTSSGQHNWKSITSSSDGIKLAAVDNNNGYIYTSTDSGATWATQTSAGQHTWRSITSSSDGNKLAAVDYNNGYIYTSSDSGVTWVAQTSSGLRQWMSIASSSDGTKLYAGAFNGYIYTSLDSGATWIADNTSGVMNWYAIASSSDGSKVVAEVFSGYIYTYAPQSTATLSTKSANLVKASTATLNSEIYRTGGANPTIRGFQYGLTTSYGQTTTENGSFIPGIYSANIANLTPSTTYHYRAYATNSIGVRYGDDKTFTTLPNSAPEVNTYGDINTTFTTATLNGAVLNDGGYNITIRGFQYGLTTSYGATSTESGAFSIGNFSYNLTNLTPNTTYHYRAYATNSLGTTYGADTTLISSSKYWAQQYSAGNSYWKGITSSDDGTKLAATANSGYIYTSTDSGLTWTAQTSSGSRYWFGINSSADGTKLAAYTGMTDYIYTSSNSGVTWVAQNGSGTHLWNNIALSDDGSKLAAGTRGDYIHTSVDGGVTWIAQTSSGQRDWYGVVSSADGTKLAAAVYNGYIYTSVDSGVTWIEQTSSGQHSWSGLTSSSDGTRLAAVDQNNGYVYTSTDSGVSWTAQTSSSKQYWTGITSSSDGMKLAAVTMSGYPFTSIDGGITWAPFASSAPRGGHDIASSADGNKLAVSFFSGPIYTYGPQTTAVVSAMSTYAVTPSTAILSGNLVSTGGNSPTVRGFEYGLTNTYGKTTSETGLFQYGGGYDSKLLTKLVCENTYHFRAYATNQAGTAYSGDATFTTGTCPTISSVATTDATMVTPTKVRLNGEITVDGGEVATRGFDYGLTTSYGTNTEESGPYHNGVFSTNLTLLSCNTTYHFRSYSTNFAGTSYGADNAFTTAVCSTIPEITSLITDTKSDITVSVSGSTTNYYIENITTAKNSSWITSSSYQFENLSCNTEYSFKVKGKASDGIETVWSDISSIFLPCVVIEATNGSISITNQQDFESGELDTSLNPSEIVGDLMLKSKPSGAKYLSQWGEVGQTEGQFSNPSGIAVDSSGNVYVSDTNNNRIQKFSADGIFIMTFGYGVVDGGSSFQICTVNCLTGISGSGDGQFNFPFGIDVDSENNIYVAERYNNRIQKFNSDGTYNSKWGIAGSENGQFSDPLGLAIDQENNIYVADSGNKRIQKFTSGGQFITKWGDVSTNPLYGFTMEKNLTIPNSWAWIDETPIPTTLMAAGNAVIGDKIFLAGGTDDGGDPFDSFYTFDPATGEWTTKVPMPYPTTSAVSAVGGDKLYVVGGKDENWNGRKTMEIYDAQTDTWTTKYNGTEEDLASMSIARIGGAGGYHDGYIYVVGGTKSSCSSNSQVSMEVYEIATNTWTTKSSAPINKLTGGSAQFIDGILYIVGGQYYCDEEYSDALVSYNPATDTWNKDLANMPGKRSGGTSVVVDGKFYYVGGTSSLNWDTQNEIFAYDPMTNTWETFGGALKEPLHRSMVSYVGNNLYVMGGRNFNWDAVDTNYKINSTDFGVLSEAQKTITSITWQEDLPDEAATLELFYSIDGGANWETLGTTPGTYDLPASVSNSLHYKVVYISPTSPNSYVSAIPSLSVNYTMDGAVNVFIDEEVSGDNFTVYNLSADNALISPTGIDIDQSGNVYVTDPGNSGNGLVYKFGSDGSFITKWGYTNSEYLRDYFSPTGIAIDNAGNVHFLEVETSVAYKTTSDGSLLFHYGDEGDTDGEFYYPQDIAIDNSDNIYITDTDNDRIEKFIMSSSGRLPSGVFVSSVINAGAVVDWTTFIKDETLSEGSSITYFTRTGGTATLDSTWSDWEVTTGEILSANNQYLQVKAVLTTTSTDSPVIHSITINYVTLTSGNTGGETGGNTGGSSGNTGGGGSSGGGSSSGGGGSSSSSSSSQSGSKIIEDPVIITTDLAPMTPSYIFVNSMRYGSKGIDVQKLQEILIGKGYLVGLADGIFGKGTQASVMALQRANNLVVDGIVGKGTIAYLNSLNSSLASTPQLLVVISATPIIATLSTNTILRFGSRKNDINQVKLIQQMLISKGYLIGTADGIFGQKTLASVLAFQKFNNLEADGLVGYSTSKLLLK